MNSDQERTCDALSLFHGGWAATEQADDDPRPNVIRLKTAGDQPNYLVLDDGSAECHAPWDHLWTMDAAEVQLAVYALEGLAG